MRYDLEYPFSHPKYKVRFFQPAAARENMPGEALGMSLEGGS